MKKYHLTDNKLWQMINENFRIAGGIYKVIWMDGDKPRQIPRLFENDIEGILYIGKAETFLNRVIELKKSVMPEYKSDNHDFGKRINKDPFRKSIINQEDLYVELIPSESPGELEKEEIKKYLIKFGELPPFNFQI